ncbi:hypothetical protein I316_06273 [Kwoniella heveanensis BCC8398]|uniref:GAF domain-containing protein n=1 Tax=Kwoniella heveanensis BCC8398 TaxID=1296120 RepID=A0A1B9GM45_9TREE|nr:hypothetical protein I316_06273 [Kwoniella heveanensis BCC8398]
MSTVPETKIVKPEVPGQNAPGFEFLLDEASRAFGYLHVTILAWSAERSSLTRIYSTDPDEFPVGGEKFMPADAEWLQTVIVHRRPHALWTKKAIKEYYNDADAILGLGAGALLSIPIILDDDKVLGAINCMGKSYTEKDLEAMIAAAPKAVQGVSSWVRDGRRSLGAQVVE